ncbi:hypothetical protein CUR178_06960 [Leishmania enriettii]|uniref:SH3 domain-containing protein n=1 Tax=Leishmania enriettii TaxID=5663 RepID=A0A836HD50_LEIEN|nr:hypothetical protein CUR178_06960 [Leishmania enriettii]
MVQPEQHIVYAIHEYAIPGDGFLPLKAGDVVHVDEADESGWWLGTNLRGHKGIFPSTYTLPYLFPPPAEDLVDDMRLILIGHEFGVSVVSGVPKPLVPCFEADACTPAASLPPRFLLCKQIDEHLLHRETVRTKVMEMLSQLMRVRACQRAERDKVAHELAAEQQHLTARSTVLRETTAALQESVLELSARKSALLQDGAVPDSLWYEGFNDLTVEQARDSASPSQEGAWRSTLKEVQQVVKRQEEELTCLSVSCSAQEDVFTRAVTSLQARVEWRDDGVARMLAYWAAKADAVKTAYTVRKFKRDAMEEARQLEAVRLVHCLEEGQEQFLSAKQLYRQLRRHVEEIGLVLQRKESLDLLSRQIAETDGAIAAHQERQRLRSMAGA